MSMKKKLFCGYPECGSEITANSDGSRVLFTPIERTNPPQPDALKQVNIYLCHQHTYEVAATLRLFDKK